MADKARVLVVEDEEDLASLLRINLELSGYEVMTAGNGVRGLEAVEREDPDLVLLDVMMPVLDGWQVLRQLKEDPQHRDLPVIMLTALAEERDLIRGHLEGAVRYVTKPFEMSTLLETVEEALTPPDDEERKRRRQTVSRLLTRLAELDSGRRAGDTIRLSHLEKTPPPPRSPQPTAAERASLEGLTDKQRLVAERLGSGQSARDLAEELGVSRSNIYATRKRIARKLRVPADDVANVVRRILEAG